MSVQEIKTVYNQTFSWGIIELFLSKLVTEGYVIDHDLYKFVKKAAEALRVNKTSQKSWWEMLKDFVIWFYDYPFFDAVEINDVNGYQFKDKLIKSDKVCICTNVKDNKIVDNIFVILDETHTLKFYIDNHKDSNEHQLVISLTEQITSYRIDSYTFIYTTECLKRIYSEGVFILRKELEDCFDKM